MRCWRRRSLTYRKKDDTGLQDNALMPAVYKHKVLYAKKAFQTGKVGNAFLLSVYIIFSQDNIWDICQILKGFHYKTSLKG